MSNWRTINREIAFCMSFRDFSSRIKCLEELLEKHGEDGMIYFNLGEVYFEMNEPSKAYEMYKRAYELFPLRKYKQQAFERMEMIRARLASSEKGSDSVLYVVNCTGDKIWDVDPHAPSFVPAIIAYQGPSFKEFLDFVEKKKIKWWLILSAKYGFIEPWHPIERYDVCFDNPVSGPITDDALRNQVLYQTRWDYTGNPRRLRDFETVYVYGSETYYEKTRKAFKGIATVVHLRKLETSNQMVHKEV